MRIQLTKHVRKVGYYGNPPNGGFPDGNHFAQLTPQLHADLFTKNITCGRLAFDSLETTEIASMVAGEEIGFRTMSEKEVNAGGSLG